MLISSNRLIVLVAFFLTAFAFAIPIIQDDGAELVHKTHTGSSYPGAPDLDPRGPRRAPQSRPRPKSKPKPIQTIKRKPKPVQTKHTPPVTRPTVVAPKSPVKTKAPAPHPPPARPTKSTKVTKTTSRTSMPSATTLPKCPAPPRKPSKKGPRAILAWVSNLFKRGKSEFIGWHGTNSDTAAYWRKEGYLAKPRGGTSGGAQELGEGIYVTDTREHAVAYANGNASKNKGTTPTTCAIFAKSASDWLSMPKVWLDDNRVGSKPEQELQRRNWISAIFPHTNAKNVPRFASLVRLGQPPSQLVIPSGIATEFVAICVGTNAAAPYDAVDNSNFYSKRPLWDIREFVLPGHCTV